jgi:hypothetical protein
MRTIRTSTIACAVALAAVLSLAPLRAQTTQTALSTEAGTLPDQFAGRARLMAGKYDWPPGEPLVWLPLPCGRGSITCRFHESAIGEGCSKFGSGRSESSLQLPFFGSSI